jgi:hypothetical protein
MEWKLSLVLVAASAFLVGGSLFNTWVNNFFKEEEGMQGCRD